MVADLVRKEIRSYRQLPAMIYHLQTKWRDDPRPRAGLIRVREFTMKDSYSLDASWEGLAKQYDAHFAAYQRIYARCELPVVAVKSDTGMMGGKEAHEFMVLTPIGVIRPGEVAGRRFRWDAVVVNTVVVRVAVNWLMGEENLSPAWSFGPAGERYEMEVRGNPNTFVTVKGWQPETVEEGLVSNPGVVATAAHCVNSIPATCAAAPGIRSFFDLPPITGRAAPLLSR